MGEYVIGEYDSEKIYIYVEAEPKRYGYETRINNEEELVTLSENDELFEIAIKISCRDKNDKEVKELIDKIEQFLLKYNVGKNDYNFLLFEFEENLPLEKVLDADYLRDNDLYEIADNKKFKSISDKKSNN